VLSTDGRYVVANRPNVDAPTDLRMRPAARGSMAELYNAISDEIFRRTPGAAITEYAHTVGRHVRMSDVTPFGVANDPSQVFRSQADATRRWTVTRIRHRYGTDLRDDLVLQSASAPLRMTRRWRTSSLNTWAREGESAFHVQYVVEHSGCATEAQQRSAARRFATAESMWEARHDLWPGEVLLDRVALLGIEPGSSAPAGWPPAPTPPPTVKPEHPVPSAPTPSAAPSAPTPSTPPSAPTPNAQVTPAPALPPPPNFGAAGSAEETKSCSVGHHGDAPLWLFALALAIAWRRRRRG
jgi:MYXO-CTERM domain-containing protein